MIKISQGKIKRALRTVVDGVEGVGKSTFAAEFPDEAGSFDRYELKMIKNVSPLVREWCDIQLFANIKIYVVATEVPVVQSA